MRECTNQTGKSKKVISAIVIAVLFITLVFGEFHPQNTYAASKIKLNKTRISMQMLTTYQLKVKGSNIVSKKFSTSSTNVANVNQKGVIQAKNVGSATITVTVTYKKNKKKKKKTLFCYVTVKNDYFTSGNSGNAENSGSSGDSGNAESSGSCRKL